MESNRWILVTLLLYVSVLVDLGHTHEDSSCGNIFCRNSGICYFEFGEPACQCAVGFSGKLCQTPTRLTEYTVTYGDNILLKCAVVKTPALTNVEWYKSVADVTSFVNISADLSKYKYGTPSQPNLKIHLTDFNDTGVYICDTNNTDGVHQLESMSLKVIGVQLTCDDFSENTASLLYNGIAQEVAFRNYNGEECLFNVTDDDKKDEFTITVNLRDDNSSNIRCMMTHEAPHLIFSSKVFVRRYYANFDVSTDFSFDVYCSYLIIAQADVTVQTESAAVTNPVVKAQPSGPKSESKFTVGIRTWNGEVLSGAKLGNPVMFKAVMIPAGGDTAFTVSSCEIFSDDKRKKMTIIAEGCGTGWPFSKTEGFTMSGTTGKSPVFKLFRIKKGSNLNIKCSFFVCKENCDGTSCLKK